MPKRFRVNDPREISRIIETIRDCWLDANWIALNSETSTLSIRFLKPTGSESFVVNRVRFPAIECFLRISRVKSFTVEDKQKIRFYDISTVEYNPTPKCVQLRTGVPIEISAVVDDFDVTVVETGTVVED
jgi:hypothetical protein